MPVYVITKWATIAGEEKMLDDYGKVRKDKIPGIITSLRRQGFTRAKCGFDNDLQIFTHTTSPVYYIIECRRKIAWRKETHLDELL